MPKFQNFIHSETQATLMLCCEKAYDTSRCLEVSVLAELLKVLLYMGKVSFTYL